MTLGPFRIDARDQRRVCRWCVDIPLWVISTSSRAFPMPHPSDGVHYNHSMCSGVPWDHSALMRGTGAGCADGAWIFPELGAPLIHDLSPVWDVLRIKGEIRGHSLDSLQALL